MQIAALLACHNRRDTTMGCLEALCQQRLPGRTSLTIFLVDDGSTDGTSEAAMRRFPKVRVIPGDGTLYWGGGMRLAWSTAIAMADYDGYLWVNDDVRLMPEAVSILIKSHLETDGAGRPGIVVGSTCDPDDGNLTYGGVCRFAVMQPSLALQRCDTMNGNIVLVPRAVFRAIGNLTPDIRHAGGDQDYGFRARRAGFEIWLAPGFLGKCRGNPPPPWADPRVPYWQRWRSIESRKGQPFRENVVYCTRHYGWRGLIIIVKTYFRVMFPGLWTRLKKRAGKPGKTLRANFN